MHGYQTQNTTRYSVIHDKDNEITDQDSDVFDDENYVVLQEVGELSDNNKSNSENGMVLDPCNSRTGWPCTTYLTCHLYGDSD